VTPARPSRPVRHPDADPDVDGVALAAATATGVFLGTRFGAAAAWVVVAASLAVACLGTGSSSRLRDEGATAVVGMLVLATLLAAGAAAASVRATAVRDGILARRVQHQDRVEGQGQVEDPSGVAHRGRVEERGRVEDANAGAQPGRVEARGLMEDPGGSGTRGRVEVAATVAEEPRRLRFGGHWVVLTVHQVHQGGRTYRIRERAGMVLPRGRLPPSGAPGGPAAGGSGTAEPARSPAAAGPIRSLASAGPFADRGEGRLAVGDRLRVRASVGRARWSDALGRQPPVVFRDPVIEERAPPAGAALRVSELVRDAARERALASLAPERAGLLVGMALGDTSLLPVELEGEFRAAGLTHLMAVSGANLAVVLAAGLSLAGLAGAGRRGLAVAGIVLVVVLVVVTRWEPSVLRAGVMAGLVLLGVATGRGPGGRRALCLAVVVLLLADPGLAGALGFQLSVAATAGVLWFGPIVARALPDRVPERVGKAVGMTLGAQATAVPALALALGPVSLAGLPANLLGLPLAGGPMLLGVVAAATAPVAPGVATLACRLADPFLLALIAVARWAAGLPGGSVTLSGPARAVPAVIAALVMLAVARWRRSPFLPRAELPVGIERTPQERDGQRRGVPQPGVLAARGHRARDLGPPDLPGPGQDVRRPLR
jgi:ComEC/Rec2-related protein